VNAQLMGLSGVRMEDKTGLPSLDPGQVDGGAGINSAGHRLHPEPWLAMLDPVLDLPGMLILSRYALRKRLVGFFDATIHEQSAVAPPALFVDGKKYQAGGFTIDAVKRCHIFDAGAAAQPVQQTFVYIATTGGDRKEMRFTGD